jgi:membrane-associated phospholipid phosphatase
MRALIAATAVAVAVAVAGSRVLLGVHWLSDVVAGLAFGWGWFAICAIAFGGRFLVFGAPVQKATRIVEQRTDEEGEPIGRPLEQSSTKR